MRAFFSLTAGLLALIGIGVGIDAALPASNGPSGLSAHVIVSTTTVPCEGAATEGASPIDLVLGPARFTELSGSRPLEAEPPGLYADKTFIVLSDTSRPNSTVEVRVKSLTPRQRVGLIYGATQGEAWNSGRYRLTPAETNYEFHQCVGTSSGFPGGVVTTGPACVSLTVIDRAGKLYSSELAFGNPQNQCSHG